MRTTNSLNLTDYLSIGEENAITAKDLAKYLRWTERDVTIAINALRKQGEFICSGASGYWLPVDDEDIAQFLRQMQGRIEDMERAMKPAQEYLNNKR